MEVEAKYGKTRGQYPSTFLSVSPEKHLAGKPCKVCLATLRYRKNGACVRCARRKARQHYFFNREARIKASQEYSKKNPRASRVAHLKRAFGMTLEQFDELLLRQDHKCAICHTATPSGRGWHVDHCHSSGKIRGILCHHCNVILGHAKDDVGHLQACTAYLNGHTKD